MAERWPLKDFDLAAQQQVAFCGKISHLKRFSNCIAGTRMGKLSCYHICYDEETKAACPEGFMPLQHSNNFASFNEIMPIFECLHTHSWEEEEFVGFFSPRFREKTGFTFETIKKAHERMGQTKNAIFFSSYLNHAAYYLNPWEQADHSNPGVLAASQKLVDAAKLNLNLVDQVCTIDNTVFSHYLIAQEPFWTAWCILVKQYFELLEDDPDLALKQVPYKDDLHSIHPFVVERFPTLITMTTGLKTAQYLDHLNQFLNDQNDQGNGERSNSDHWRLSFFLDHLKKQYLDTNDRQYLDSYWANRVRHGLGTTVHTKTARNYLREAEMEVWAKGVRVNGSNATG